MQKIDIIKTLESADAAPAGPVELFSEWLAEAASTDIPDPNAMALATADSEGRPSVRIVLLKSFDERGFVFYTNRESRKAMELKENRAAALCFHWRGSDRQIRVEGDVTPLPDVENGQYFDTRPYGSRIGAWASRQSRTLESRTALRERVAEFADRYKEGGNIPCPPHWGGYRLAPRSIEFWHEGEYRLHTRLLYEKDSNGAWQRRLLFP